MVQEVERAPRTAGRGGGRGRSARAVAEEHEVAGPRGGAGARRARCPRPPAARSSASACRAAYPGGRAGGAGAERVAASGAAVGGGARRTAAGHPAERLHRLAARTAGAAAGRCLPAALDPDRRSPRSGLDSLAAVELQQRGRGRARRVAAPWPTCCEGASLGELARASWHGLEEAPSAGAAPAATGPETSRSRTGSRRSGSWSGWTPEPGATTSPCAARVRGRWTCRRSAPRPRGAGGPPPGAAHHLRRWWTASRCSGSCRTASTVDFVAEERHGDRSAAAVGGCTEAWRPFDLERGPLLRVAPVSGGRRRPCCSSPSTTSSSTSGRWPCWPRELGALRGRRWRSPPLAGWRYTRLRPLAGRAAGAGPAGERLLALLARSAWRGLPALALPHRPAAAGRSDLARRSPGRALAGRTAGAARGARRASEGPRCSSVCSPPSRRCSHRYAGQDDFAVGAPTARPRRAGAGRRGRLLRQPGGAAGRPRRAIRRSGSSWSGRGGPCSAALEHQELPFAAAGRAAAPGARSGPAAARSRRCFVLQQRRPGDEPALPAFALGEEGVRLALGGLELESVALAERRAQFDLALTAAELPRAASGSPWSQRRPLRRRDRRAHARALPDAARRGWRPTPERPALGPAAADRGRARPAARGSGARRAASRPWTPAVHELVAEQASRTPEAAAVLVAARAG